MTVTGVAGFFSQKKRSLRPVGLDLTVLYDESGSSDNINRFIKTDSFIRNVELALSSVGIGTKAGRPNRYSRGAHEEEVWLTDLSNVVAGEAKVLKRWATGQEVLTGSIWGSGGSSPNILELGANSEDVTGSAHAVATKNREYRSGIQRILISSSDEQSGGLQGNTQQNLVEGALTASDTGQIFIGLSSIKISANPNPETEPRNKIFGFVFTTPTEGVLITFSGTSVNYYNVPVSSVTFLGEEDFFQLDGPIVYDFQGGVQTVNTPRLAAATGGAVYDMQLFTESGALDAFGTSLGQVLGTFLYQLLA